MGKSNFENYFSHMHSLYPYFYLEEVDCSSDGPTYNPAVSLHEVQGGNGQTGTGSVALEEFIWTRVIAAKKPFTNKMNFLDFYYVKYKKIK